MISPLSMVDRTSHEPPDDDESEPPTRVGPAPRTPRMDEDPDSSDPHAHEDRTIVAAVPEATTAMPLPAAVANARQQAAMANVSRPPGAGPGASGGPAGGPIVPAAPAGAALVRGQALFRRESLEAHLAAARESDVLRVAPPWSRVVFWMTASVVVAAVTLACLFDIEQTGFARGILRVAGGVQTVNALAGGVVLELGAQSGDVVEQNKLLVRVDSAQTRSQLLEVTRQIELAEQRVKEFGTRRDQSHTQRVALLKSRAGLLARRVANQERSVVRLSDKSRKYAEMQQQGLVSGNEKAQVEDETLAAEREALRLREELSSTQLQIANIALELDTERAKLEGDVKQARDKKEALEVQLTQTEVRAPRKGRLEALLVKTGDTVNVGAPIAKLVPEGAARQIIVFVPERDRAFLNEGADARVEVDQLPSGEFGTLRATVSRIASDLASSTEATEALGEQKVGEPVYRVELTLQQNDSLARVEQLLRPGSLVTARFALRKRRIITVLFEPLRRFFQ